MFGSRSSSKLRIDAPQHVQFVHPTPEGELPREELILNGTISLVLSKPKRIDEILVRLVSTVNIATPGLNFQETLMEKVERAQIENPLFSPGTHQFAFTFPVPVSTKMLSWSDLTRLSISQMLLRKRQQAYNLMARLIPNF